MKKQIINQCNPNWKWGKKTLIIFCQWNCAPFIMETNSELGYIYLQSICVIIPHKIQTVYHCLSAHTQSQPSAALQCEYVEEIHWSIFILGKVPGSILSRYGRIKGWKSKEKEKPVWAAHRVNRSEERNEKLRSVEYCGLNVERSVECSAASHLLGSPAPTLLLLPSVCRWRHCRGEGFHIGWCHPIHISPSVSFSPSLSTCAGSPR